MKYADIEGLEKKDPFKKGIIDVLKPTSRNLFKYRLKILPQSLGEPAALIDFLDYDFYLAFKTDGVGTKSLIADLMAKTMRKKAKYSQQKIIGLYAGLGIDLIATNVNDLICLGAKPFALVDEIAAGNYKKFLDKELIAGLFKGLKKGCLEANISIPAGESPTLVDIIAENTISMTASSLGLVKPKENAIWGDKLKSGDAIFGLTSNGIHTNGLSLARKIIEKLPKGYFTKFDGKTIGEVLLKPTKIYVKPVIEMLDQGVQIHYMSHISGNAFKKIMRSKKRLTYIIEKIPKKPIILQHLQQLEKIPEEEAYETWNMGLGFVIFAPENQEKKIKKICKSHQVDFLKMGYVQKGNKQVIIEPKNIAYKE